MAAYAALLSLARSLHQILDLHHHIDSLHKERFISLLEKVDFIVAFLEEYSEKQRGALVPVGNEIRNAAYEAQDFIDSYLYSVSTAHDGWSSPEEVSLDRCLDMAFERINFIWAEAMEMKKEEKVEVLRTRTYSSPVDHSSAVEITGNKVMGFYDDVNLLKEQLYEDSGKLKVIPIVGMGGIGKTTLARRAYEDSLSAQYFDIFAWTTVSGEYQRKDTLLELLQSLKKYIGDLNETCASEANLETLVYQNLKDRRYLIVIDDIWSTKAWDDLKMIFPDDDNASRILLTTRLSDVALYAVSSRTSIHQVKFLNEDQCWELLQKKIFGQESCPLHLVELGKKVARNCRGLPLTIVVVAGLLLSSGNIMEEEMWKSILKNISSTETTIPVQCSKILCLSYDWLPLRLKPCFLYMAAFRKDFKIDISKLIMLWVAEGFLKPSGQFKCLEDLGKRYLEDLVNRNLILVSRKGPDGEIFSIEIHDLLRKFCMKKAEEEGFIHHVSSIRNDCNDAIENPKRRLCVYGNQYFQGLRTQESSVRSIFSETKNFCKLSPDLRRLSILNTPKVIWWNLPDVISTFVNLRYISINLDKQRMLCASGFFAALSKLPNLETFVAYIPPGCFEFRVAYEILRMPKLRHLVMSRALPFSHPSDIGIIDKSDLQTLGIVLDFIFTEYVIKILVNLKKLTLAFENYCGDWDDFNLNNLFLLQNLEELEVTLAPRINCFVHEVRHPFSIWNYTFPINLKKLTLRGVAFPWENMILIGSLPNLQVLEIVDNEINRDSKWTPTEGQFPHLKYFRSSLDYLVKWEVEKDHLPSLESLILEKVKGIDEIPYGIGEIDTLQLIELQDCNESLVNSAKRIEKQQHENGNDAFQVNVFKYVDMTNFY